VRRWTAAVRPRSAPAACRSPPVPRAWRPHTSCRATGRAASPRRFPGPSRRRDRRSSTPADPGATSAVRRPTAAAVAAAASSSRRPGAS